MSVLKQHIYSHFIYNAILNHISIHASILADMPSILLLPISQHVLMFMLLPIQEMMKLVFVIISGKGTN